MTAKRYAVLNGDAVIAAIIWNAAASPDYVFPEVHTTLIEHEAAMPGWTLQGGVLTDPDPPQPDPDNGQRVDDLYPPLEKWRFWTVVRSPGSLGEARLRGAIEAHPDEVFKAMALSLLDDPPGGLYWRSNPLFADATLLGALEIDAAAVNTMWMAGHALSLPA